jgi:hypothetical protein
MFRLRLLIPGSLQVSCSHRHALKAAYRHGCNANDDGVSRFDAIHKLIASLIASVTYQIL